MSAFTKTVCQSWPGLQVVPDAVLNGIGALAPRLISRIACRSLVATSWPLSNLGLGHQNCELIATDATT